MTVSVSETGISTHVGNNTTDTYDYEFEITAAADLKVTQTDDAISVDTLLVLTTDYSVTDVGDENGGTIVLVAGNLATGQTLTIEDEPQLSQDTPYTNQGGFFGSTHESSFDKLTRLVRQGSRALDRVIKIPATSSGVNTETTPSPLKYLRWNALADAIEGASGTVGDASSVLYTPAGVGAVPTTVLDVLRRTISFEDFGAVGDGTTDDTAAIDAAFAFIESEGYVDGAAVNGVRNILLATDTWAINAGKGEYVYSGAGYTPINQKVIVLKGQSPASSTIRIDSDVHLIHPTDSSPVMNYIEISDLKVIGGRGAYFSEKTNLNNVQQGKRFDNCVFAGYTSVAVGSVETEDTRWSVTRCLFEGGNTGTPVGLLLPDEVADPHIQNNNFFGNKYDIITASDGIAAFIIGPNNVFLNLAGRIKEADIWIQPGDNQIGLGIRLFGNRHSNENKDGAYPEILFADRDGATAAHIFGHLTTVSAGDVNGLIVSNNYINANGNPNDSLDHTGFIKSYTPNVGGLRWLDNHLGQWRPYIMEYAAAITASQIDGGLATTNFARMSQSRKPDNKYLPIKFTNVDGAGLFEFDNGFSNGASGCLARGGDIDLVTKIHTSSVTRGWTKGGSVVQADITDNVVGLTGSTFTFPADEVVVPSLSRTNIKAGQIIWIEFDVKRSSSTPLDYIVFEYVINNSPVVSFQFALTSDWQRIQIPIITTRTHTDSTTFGIRVGPRLHLDAGTKDSFDVGRYCCYHSQAPVDYSISSIDGNLSIASGIVTITSSAYFNISTESSASTDDLDSINGGHNGQVITLFASDSADTVVCKDNVGNLKLSADFSLTHLEDTITLIYNGSDWVEISRSDNTA